MNSKQQLNINLTKMAIDQNVGNFNGSMTHSAKWPVSHVVVVKYWGEC